MVCEFLGLCNPLLLGAPVLEPDLDLGVGELQVLGKVRPLGDGEIALGLVLLLEPVQLLRGEGGPRLPVRPVLPAAGAGGEERRGALVLTERSQKKELRLLRKEGKVRIGSKRGRGDAE